MTHAEHSTLVFLLMSLQAAPVKAKDFLRLAARTKPSTQAYTNALERLRSAVKENQLMAVCETMRTELRAS